jgi:hypothetical protein
MGNVRAFCLSPGGRAERFCFLSKWEAELMVLTQGCVNGVAIGIVAVAVARLWKWPSWWKRYRASRKRGDLG